MMKETDSRLVENAVRHVTRTCGHPLWTGIASVFSVPSGQASALCRRFGLDPDEVYSCEEEDCERCQGEEAENVSPPKECEDPLCTDCVTEDTDWEFRRQALASEIRYMARIDDDYGEFVEIETDEVFICTEASPWNPAWSEKTRSKYRAILHPWSARSTDGYCPFCGQPSATAPVPFVM